ncbi:MAG TPA: ABC transporter substrate-binding protein [Gemmatimonadaceae bacterium]|nr:ABC transporter substrate-binding protein [Gemmatimonadaceae bacterium]
MPGRSSACFAVALILVLCAACNGESSKRGNRLVVAAITTDPGQLNTAITTNGSVHNAGGLLYDGLVALDEAVKPLPALAERWEVENKGALYRFHLRKDVRWHDGKPFTAADVRFTFEELLLKFHSRARASLAPALDHIATPDQFTVEFHFRRPYAPLLQQLDEEEAPILPRHVFAGQDPLRNPANVAPIGTGPYRFVSYVGGSEIRYAANDRYFRGAPAVREVILRIIPDAGIQVLALEKGEVDWLFGVPGPERNRLRRDRRFRLLQTRGVSGSSNCISTIGFNLDKRIFQDVRFRRAVAHAVDRRQFLDRVLFGEGSVAGAPISSGIAFAHAAGLAMPELDTTRTARLLDSIGWRRSPNGMRASSGIGGTADGTPLTVRFTAMPGQAQYGDLLRAQLRAVGIDVRIEVLEPAVFAQQIFTARDFDLALVAYCNGTDPEIGVRRQYVSSNIAPVPFSNLAAYRNAVVDSLFDKAASSLEPVERGMIYRQIQEIAVRDQPYLWLVETLNTRAYNVRCEGFNTSSHFAATAKCTR